jgi:uncharacterized integral membrane protein
MSSLLELARRTRRHHTTESPAAEPGPSMPAMAAPATPANAAPESDPVTSPAVPQQPSGNSSVTPRGRIVRTRISGAWVAVLVAVVGVVFLLIFILQNLSRASVSFLGFGGTLPMGVAMLFAAVAGALLIALVGSARILQLRHGARSRRH